MAWYERAWSTASALAHRWREHKVPLGIGAGVFVLAAIAFRLAHSHSNFWGIDDAGITYAYAFQLADHHSLAPFLEGPPVEAYSNPLLFFVVTLLRLFGLFDPITTHVLLEPLVFAAMVTLAWAVLRMWVGEVAALVGTVLFAAIELLVPATWIWYASGLENVWLSAGLLLLVWMFARTARGVPLEHGWGTAAFLVAIIRPEAPVYVAGFYLALVAFARPDGVSRADHLRRAARALTVTSALYVAFLLWRHHAYGEWLPNTYFAKLSAPASPFDNLRDHVFAQLFPYCSAGIFAACLLALLGMPRMERLAMGLGVFLLASLALPITAGADFMGEHRFATAFFAMTHLIYAVFVAACVARVMARPRPQWRAAHVLGLAGALLLPLTLITGHLAIVDKIPLSDVSITRVAYLQGAQRWEHQMRLGVPDAVVMLPDAGGSLLIGSMQMVDSGYLTDFQTPRLGHDLTDPIQRRLLDQYELVERHPDLVDDSHNFPIDHETIEKQYPSGEGRLYARGDLVELPRVPDGAQLLWDSPELQIYLSPSTVLAVGPRGLARCELIVAWHGAAPTAGSIRATVGAQGDRDEISLRPYKARPDGIERRAVLVGAPEQLGSLPVRLELITPDGGIHQAQPFRLDVTNDAMAIRHAADDILRGTSPADVAFRIAWLREQAIPRMRMTTFRIVMSALAKAFHTNSGKAGRYIMHLRWNARLATLEQLPSPIRAAELVAARRLIDTCPAAVRGVDPAPRIACLGRAIDQLRRLGYLGLLQRTPELAAELRDTRMHLGTLPPASQYLVLFGLVRADPSDIDLQRRLLEVRARLGATASLPELPMIGVR